MATEETVGLGKIDPTLNFGKHKGTRLSEAPETYLQWLAIQDPKIQMGNRDWSTLAIGELIRRRTGESLPDGLVVAPNEEGGRAGFVVKPSRKAHRDNVLVAMDAVNGASLFLLKEFILRKDKTQNIGGWLAELAKEAWAYGVPFGPPGDEAERQYVGMRFFYQLIEEPPTMALARIVPIGKD